MMIDIYRSTKQPNKYVAVKAGQDITDPEVGITDADFKTVEHFRSNVLLEKGMIGMDPVKAEEDIKEKNHHITGSSVRISVELSPLK